MTTYRLRLCHPHLNSWYCHQQSLCWRLPLSSRESTIATTTTKALHSPPECNTSLWYHDLFDVSSSISLSRRSRGIRTRYLVCIDRLEVGQTPPTSTLLKPSSLLSIQSHTNQSEPWVLGQHTTLKNHTSVKTHRQSHTLFRSIHTQIASRLANIGTRTSAHESLLRQVSCTDNQSVSS